MTCKKAAIYQGTVAHTRLRPKKHRLRYSVFSILLDLRTIDEVSENCRLFSRNRFNFCSFYVRDHIPPEYPDIDTYVRSLLNESGIDNDCARIQLLCYPRVFGYAFNPLTVYFCYNSTDKISAIIYQVKNTFGEQHSYVIPLHSVATTPVTQSCSKEFFVSPFNSEAGKYRFRIEPPSESVSICITYENEEVPILKAYFKGSYVPFKDRNLVSLLIQNPFMTFKVMAGIHFEALLLWLKGLSVFKHKKADKFGFTVVTQRRNRTYG